VAFIRILKMSKKLYLIAILCTVFTTSLNNLRALNDLATMTKELQDEQVNDPNNPQTNYNLGVSLYKQKQFEQAITNFDRSIKNCSDKDIVLKKYGYFNLGNSFYKNALSKLPENWENSEVEDKVLDAAVNLIKNAIDNYKSCLKLEKNSQSEHNKNKSEELLKKLENKKKKQQQSKDKKQDDNKNSQQKKDNDQENDNKQNQNKDQQNKDGDKSKDQSDKSKSDDGSTKPNNSQDQKNQQGNSKKESNNSKDNGQDKPKKDQQQNNSEQHDKSSEDKKTNESTNAANGNANKEEKQGATNHKEDMESQALGAMLENLQSGESKLHKNLIARKINANKPPLRNNQRPW